MQREISGGAESRLTNTYSAMNLWGGNFGAVQNTDYRGTIGFCASFAVRFGFFIFLRYILNFFVARCTIFLRYREIINIKFVVKRIVISVYFNLK